MTIMNDEKKKRRVLLIAFSIHMILFCSVTILLLPVVIDGELVLFYILCGLDLLDLMVLTVKLVIDGFFQISLIIKKEFLLFFKKGVLFYLCKNEKIMQYIKRMNIKFILFISFYS